MSRLTRWGSLMGTPPGKSGCVQHALPGIRCSGRLKQFSWPDGGFCGFMASGLCNPTERM